jgi:hypothetical protein
MTALLLLTHEPAECVNRMTRAWREITSPGQIILAYGGPRHEFALVEGQKVYVEDPRLRTRDHQREKQSYTKLLQQAVGALQKESWDALYLAEYDMLPLVPDLFTRLRDHASRERADLLGHRAWRIDDTLHPHYSHNAANADWLGWIQSISIRDEKSVILSCMGCGQWWSREALEAVLALGEPVPAYLELHLPTVAHHIGFRVRGIPEQDVFMRSQPFPREVSRDQLKRQGAWLMHPDKSLWNAAASLESSFS